MFVSAFLLPAAAVLLSAVDKMAGHRKFPELENNSWEFVSSVTILQGSPASLKFGLQSRRYC